MKPYLVYVGILAGFYGAGWLLNKLFDWMEKPKVERFRVKPLPGMTEKETIEMIEEAAIKSAANMGAPENMWDEEGRDIIINGKPTEYGLQLFQKIQRKR